ncbi:MAG TPA: GNAT family N-acetyltransferase [Ktedonobacterales bacterium]|jgi:acetyltransferase
MAFRGNFGGGCIVVRLADGASVTVRAVHDEPQDDDALRDLFFNFSDTTRYRYFLAGVPPNEVWAERFVALSRLDGRRCAAVVAEVDGRLVGFACFRQHPQADPDDDMAEVGIVLTDAWQGRGLGGHLLTWLAREALRREVSTLVAETLADNQRMLRLARRTFPNLRVACASGSCTLTIDLDAWQDDARRGYERVAC